MKGVAKHSFELRNARNGTRVLTEDIKDFQAVKAHFDQNNLCYFTFFPKSEKPLKAVIHYLPSNTPAEDIAKALLDLGFDVIIVKQMRTTRRSTPEQPTPLQRPLPLLLITLSRTPKSQEIFKITNLCHIAIKVEAYRSRNSLTQCFNCQQFGHV
jgi:hypothetical protein